MVNPQYNLKQVFERDGYYLCVWCFDRQNDKRPGNRKNKLSTEIRERLVLKHDSSKDYKNRKTLSSELPPNVSETGGVSQELGNS